MGTMVAGSTNLADAYPRQAPTASQLRVFGKLPQLYAEATSRSQRAIEEEFVEPARPRIASTLRREGVELLPLPEWQLRQGVAAGVASSLVDVVWLVAPNNPTGWPR